MPVIACLPDLFFVNVNTTKIMLLDFQQLSLRIKKGNTSVLCMNQYCKEINKHHDIAEILLKLVLNTKQPIEWMSVLVSSGWQVLVGQTLA
jgi:hypothetical protein